MSAPDNLVLQILAWVGGATAWPEGDADQAREAARIWNQLAEKVETNADQATSDVASVWLRNEGEGVEAFKKFWTKNFGGQIMGPSLAEPYPQQVAEHARRVAQACEAYAEAIEKHENALTIIAWVTWTNILFTISWGWVTGWAGIGAQLLLIRNRTAVAVAAQQTLFRRIMLKIVEWMLDSLGYAAGQQIVQLGTFAVGDLFMDYDDDTKRVLGFDPYSGKANLEQFGRGFLANMAFDASMDGATPLMRRVPGAAAFFDSAGKSGLPNRLLSLGGRMVGTNMYTITDNWLQGKPPEDWLPSGQQEVAKLFMHVPRLAKNPAKGPIGAP
ncbi:hypothetical protein SAMN04489712_112198 [Thermomonospora echinospora]|uniref:Outer membrane channel protein CpnT-like N-terminal domain-containing protein n=1 Tax=Thermomonospora echinospora TaxID=1992 RepID=A0A1H6D229_9ACTN|nr:hypothetical protein [Thermomonospora echinospora]SEG79317.1 hypothetical protein SAMN04489712_112198 [Thermomonospora echinospora]